MTPLWAEKALSALFLVFIVKNKGVIRKVHRFLTKKRALEIIEGFSRSGVLVIGDVMVDHFIWGNVSRISPEAPVPVVDVQKDSILLGGCANVLNNIHAMGGKAYVAGVIGNDNIGRNLLKDLADRKIDTKGIVVEKNRPTTLKTRIVAHGQQMVRFDKEGRKPITEAGMNKILTYVKSLRHKIGAIVISDYNKGVVSKELIEGIKKIVDGQGVYICLDPKQSNFSIYRGVDVITPNHFEVQRAAGVEILENNDIERLSESLLKKFNFPAILVTRGEGGMSLFEKGRKPVHTHFPAQAREIYDVTGAGDTVIGMLALGLAAKATIKEATCLANLAAGIVVEKIGTATVSQKEFIELL